VEITELYFHIRKYNYIPSIAICKLEKRPQNFGTGLQAVYMRQVRSALSESCSR